MSEAPLPSAVGGGGGGGSVFFRIRVWGFGFESLGSGLRSRVCPPTSARWSRGSQRNHQYFNLEIKIARSPIRHFFLRTGSTFRKGGIP